MRAAVLLPAVLLAASLAAAEPVLEVRDDKRSLGIASLAIEYHDGRLRVRVESATGGVIEGEGTWADGALEAELKARDLDAHEADIWMLRAGPLPHASGRMDGEATIRWQRGQPLRIEAALRHRTGHLEWVGLGFRAPIEARGVVLIGGGTVLRDLNTRAAEARLGDLEFENLDCVVHLHDKVLRLENLHGKGYGALWRGATEWDFREAVPAFRLSLQVEDELQDEPYEFTPEDGKALARIERIDGGMQTRGRWTGDDGWRDTLRGSGTLRMRGGELMGSPILPAVWNALIGRVPLVKQPSLPSFLDEPNRMIESRLSYELRDGAAHSDDLYIETGDFVAEGSARLGLDESIDARLEVALTQEGISRIFTQVALPLPKSSFQLGRIPVRVTGTWSDQTAQADVERVPRSVLRMIFGYALRP